MAYQVCDIRPGKGITRYQSNEHLRNYTQRAYENKRTGNFDPTREHLNFEVTQGGVISPVNKKKSIPCRIKEILKARGISDPNQGMGENDERRRRTVANIILQGSREQMRRLAFGEQKIDEGTPDCEADNSSVVRKPEIEQWATDMYNFMSKKYGEKNIAAFVVHLDEKNPHIHCALLPVAEIKGYEQLSWNAVFGGNKYDGAKKMKELHDELAEVNVKWGRERGRDVHETGARHRTTEEYWKQLSDSCSNLEKEEQRRTENVKELQSEIARAERRVKGLTTMIANLNDQILELENEIAKRRIALENTDDLQKQHDELLAKLVDKKQKLQAAHDKLWDLSDQYKNILDHIDEAKSQLSRLRPEIRDSTIKQIKSLAWDAAKDEMAKVKSKATEYKNGLPLDERQSFSRFEMEVFSENIIEDMAERADEIINVATSLFLGYIDQATTFVHTHGGGGSPGSGWGRKKDEDDKAFMNRCFGMARMMMRPVKSRIKR